MNKNKYKCIGEVLGYISIFLFACLSTVILASLYFLISGSGGREIMFSLVWLGFLSIILKLIIPITMSLCVIKKNDNQILLRLYNNIKIPSIILFFLIGFDFIVKHYVVKQGYYYDAYSHMFGTYPVFLVIYVIAIINTIKLKLAKNNNINS